MDSFDAGEMFDIMVMVLGYLRLRSVLLGLTRRGYIYNIQQYLGICKGKVGRFNVGVRGDPDYGIGARPLRARPTTES